MFVWVRWKKFFFFRTYVLNIVEKDSVPVWWEELEKQERIWLTWAENRGTKIRGLRRRLYYYKNQNPEETSRMVASMIQRDKVRFNL